MRKTTASRPPTDRGALSHEQSGLMDQGTNAQESATAESALANRFHRTCKWTDIPGRSSRTNITHRSLFRHSCIHPHA